MTNHKLAVYDIYAVNRPDPSSAHSEQVKRGPTNKQVQVVMESKADASYSYAQPTHSSRQSNHEPQEEAGASTAAAAHESTDLKDEEISRLRHLNEQLQNQLKKKDEEHSDYKDTTAARRGTAANRSAPYGKNTAMPTAQSRKEKRNIIQLAVAVLLVIPFIWTQNKPIEFDATGASNAPSSERSALSAAAKEVRLTSEEAENQNAHQVKQWRDTLSKQCTDATTKEEVQSIFTKTKEGFVLPTSLIEQPRSPTKATKRCKLVVLDFGANIGDTAGHAIDSGLFTCDRKDLGIQQNQLRINITSGAIEEGRRNPLTQWLERKMKELSTEQNTHYSSEDYCYYGIEGNPVFTTRLQRMEDLIISMHPRPLKHLHFFTESVGAGEVGMTKLYLDTVNDDKNFWGSSIFKDHGDVRKSALQSTNLSYVEANVMGYTVSELLLMTMKQFDPNMIPQEDRKGGHLLLKVDIEGGEWPLILEAANNGTLCHLAEMGNKVDLFVEFHSEAIIGPNPLRKKMNKAKEALTSCGVEFRKLGAWWA